ncbi:MAG: AraC family transcriptional regulator, partial [Clostridia bacterium]|nr:AraC family transcriptional regulator [Clostridia bacterium]
GFSTTSYFIQRFREYQGMTPKRFRNWFEAGE